MTAIGDVEWVCSECRETLDTVWQCVCGVDTCDEPACKESHCSQCVEQRLREHADDIEALSCRLTATERNFAAMVVRVRSLEKGNRYAHDTLDK